MGCKCIELRTTAQERAEILERDRLSRLSVNEVIASEVFGVETGSFHRDGTPVRQWYAQWLFADLHYERVTSGTGGFLHWERLDESKSNWQKMVISH